jgi:DNA-binding transcriptional MerR regulator
MASGPFTLAQLAKAAGMSIEDVRLYRDRGLLQPPRRQRGRTDHFAYRQEHVDRLCFIGRARGHGFSFEAIAELVDAEALQTCNDVYRFSVRQLEELQRRSGPGDSAVVALEKLIATCSCTGARRDCEILARLAWTDGDGA